MSVAEKTHLRARERPRIALICKLETAISALINKQKNALESLSRQAVTGGQKDSAESREEKKNAGVFFFFLLILGQRFSASLFTPPVRVCVSARLQSRC